MTAEHRIDDYARPRLPLPIRALNALGGPIMRARAKLDEASLLEAARRDAGLDDFGDDHFREPLGVLLRAIEQESHLTPFGRFLTRRLLVQLLSTRLRAVELWRRHPEILEAPVEAPIVIIGLPRTGTTHLHCLIGEDPALRTLPYYESLEPLPPKEWAPGSSRPDPRIARCEQAVKFMHSTMPLFPLMHEMAPFIPHEEVQLLAVELSTMLFEASYSVPSYRDWYLEHDQTPAYQTLKRMLQTLQWFTGRKRWVLKSPQHLEQIGPLLSVFPDARIVQTHRDPVRVTASFTTLGAYTLRMNCGGIDPHVVGRYWADRIERMLNASVDQRDLIPDGQVLDCHFHEFMADELGMAGRIYAFADQRWSNAVEKALRAYLGSHRRGRKGTVRYDLAAFGLDADERRGALRHYQERFGVPDE